MQRKANEILAIIYEFRNLASAAEPLCSEAEVFQLNKIETSLAKGEPIHMILPAFPAKSPNPQKTMTVEPDYGEVLALERLNNLCARIKAIYAPGAFVTICSDGRVFSDVVQVSDESVDVYNKAIRSIILDRKLRHLTTFNLEDVYGTCDYSAMRARLVNTLAETLETVRNRVLSDAETKFLFNGVHRFLFEDQIVINPQRSRNASRETAKHLTYEVIRRSNAWSRLVEKQFPEALRLSIHPQSARSTKIGVRLVNSNDRWRTPWHSVAVFDGKDFFLAPRAEAERSGAQLTYAFEKYPYYLLTNAEAV